jgi:hypothetical protein
MGEPRELSFFITFVSGITERAEVPPRLLAMASTVYFRFVEVDKSELVRPVPSTGEIRWYCTIVIAGHSELVSDRRQNEPDGGSYHFVINCWFQVFKVTFHNSGTYYTLFFKSRGLEEDIIIGERWTGRLMDRSTYRFSSRGKPYPVEDRCASAHASTLTTTPTRVALALALDSQ